MNVHKNARLTPRGREILISRLERGEHPLDVATAYGRQILRVVLDPDALSGFRVVLSESP